MFFRKKRRMIDVGELQRRGVVRLPEKEIHIPTNNEGFVEISDNKKTNSDLFGFGGNVTSNESFSSECDGYNKREVDAKIQELDSSIYKLEQRLEVLERKAGVNSAPNNSGSIIGW